jgi:uncharacterized protein (TIGR00369 family)
MSLPDVNALRAFLQDAFPQAHEALHILSARPGAAALRLATDARHLRPGNTVSGPAMMMLADTAAYVALLASVGLEALAVTTHLSIDFLRKPPAGAEVEARAEIVKLGRRLVVASVRIVTDEALVATASVTYSRPGGGSA